MNYITIYKNDIANGVGIGVVIFTAGCRCNCHKCHNPEAWDFNAGKPFTKEAENEVFEALDKPYISRLTFSGGHPLDPKNLQTVTSFARKIKERFTDKSIWIYTGYLWENVKYLPVMQYTDVLVDGKFEYKLKDISLAFRGSKNQRVIDVQKSLLKNRVILYCE